MLQFSLIGITARKFVRLQKFRMIHCHLRLVDDYIISNMQGIGNCCLEFLQLRLKLSKGIQCTFNSTETFMNERLYCNVLSDSLALRRRKVFCIFPCNRLIFGQVEVIEAQADFATNFHLDLCLVVVD